MDRIFSLILLCHIQNSSMLFQYQIPELPNILETQEITQNQQLFGPNSFSQQTLDIINSVFEKLLEFNENNFMYQSDFDEDDIQSQIMTYFKVGCNFSPPNIIILNAENPQSNDSAMHECLKIYF